MSNKHKDPVVVIKVCFSPIKISPGGFSQEESALATSQIPGPKEVAPSALKTSLKWSTEVLCLSL
jgi:hypothetical protein